MAQALFLIGFTALTAQTVLMRELLVVCAGNEVCLGLTLAAWLLWTAAGSALAPRHADAGNQMAVLQAATALVLPLTIVGVRHGRSLVGAMPGEMLSPGAMGLVALLTLAPFCLISGALFATGVRLYGARSRGGEASAAAKVYLLETLGSGVAGLVASLFLLDHSSATQIALFLAWLNLIAAAGLAAGPHWYRRTELLAWLILVPLLTLPALIVYMETSGIEQVWPGMQVVETRNSRYGNLAVVSLEETQTLYENGLAAFHVPDQETAEESVHFALLEHPAPGRVLVIGGGMNGSLRQALKHPSVAWLDYAELDPMVLDLARRHFAAEWNAVASDTRVHLHSVDGRVFLRGGGAAYDAILVNLPDPQTAQLNRFYTAEFFREAAARLEPGGVLAFQVTGAENYISPRLASFLRCLRATLGDVFPDVVLLPGAMVHFVACRRQGTLTEDPAVLSERIRRRGLETVYVREAFLTARLSPERRAELNGLTRSEADTPRNRDFAPVAFFFDIALWGSRFGAAYGKAFAALEAFSFAALAAALTLLSAVVGWLSLRRGAVVEACVGGMGFTLIGVEVMLLVGFQAVHGYVYHELALIMACFMAGMALGSYSALRTGGSPDLALPQALGGAAAWLVCLWMPHAPAAGFAAAAVLAGALGGWQFPVACRAARKRAPGTLYAADLAGAALGAVVFSLWLLPVYGFARSAALLALVNLPLAVAAWIGRPVER